MFIYQVSPIDDFRNLIPVHAYIESLLADKHSDVASAINKLFSTLMPCAHAIAKHKDSWWRGDIYGGLYVFAVPDPHSADAELGLVWKQGQSGATFVCSPVPLKNTSSITLLGDVII